MEKQRHPVNIHLVGVMQKEAAKVRHVNFYILHALLNRYITTVVLNEILDDVWECYNILQL